MSLTTEGSLLDTKSAIMTPARRSISSFEFVEEVTMNRFENGGSSAETKEKVLSEPVLDEGAAPAGGITTKRKKAKPQVFAYYRVASRDCL